jgi:hypothetical protein
MRHVHNRKNGSHRAYGCVLPSSSSKYNTVGIDVRRLHVPLNQYTKTALIWYDVRLSRFGPHIKTAIKVYLSSLLNTPRICLFDPNSNMRHRMAASLLTNLLTYVHFPKLEMYDPEWLCPFFFSRKHCRSAIHVRRRVCPGQISRQSSSMYSKGKEDSME